MLDRSADRQPGLTSPARKAVLLVAAAAADLEEVPRAIHANQDTTAVVVFQDDLPADTVELVLAAGAVYPYRIRRLVSLSVGTSIVGLF